MQTKTNRPSRAGRNFGRRRSFSSTNSNNKRPNRSGGRSFSSGHSRQSGRGGARSGRKMPTFDPSQFINTNPVETTPEIYEPKHRFSTFGLSGKLVRTINSLGMERPSPIQDQIIPYILEGKDVIGLAQTGTGKTAAFLIPLIEKTLKKYDRQTLILTPTRELALQVQDELRKLSEGNKIYSTICVGGTSIRPQIQSLRRKNHFIIGTPGRILDLIDRKNLKTQHINTVVLDEADRMLDMGFINDIRKVLTDIPKNRETLLFSATMDESTKKVVDEFLNDPVKVSVKKKDVTNSILQDVVPYKRIEKFETLTSLLENPEFKRVIVFGAMKHSVEKLGKSLTEHGIKAVSIHGNKNHGQRQKALRDFKSGHARVLVATDVAARGIHVDNVSHVINYDLPNTFEDYVHRIGRTGRADKNGKALTFIPTH
ncbi:MAG: DEAD/DEAH box helicase [Gelidibacter sp.]|nr:DEAD/DEAH box helicase [Gelidibacter sp.]